MNEIIEKFKEETGYELTVKEGKLFYDGNLDLKCTGIVELPDNLTVMGYLDLNDTDIDKLPNNLSVKNCLYAKYTYINEIPDSLKVGDSIYLDYTPITKLPDNLNVRGCLSLNGTNITKLPDNLTVTGYLSLRCTHLKKIPNNLIVGDFLDLSNTPITELPDNLIVGGYIALNDTKIKELPNNLTLGGSLLLSGTPITELPDNLTINGNLELSDTKITKLPDNLTVIGDLYLYGINLRELPNNLTIKDKLYIRPLYFIDFSQINRNISPQHINNCNNNAIFLERDGVKYIKADGIFSVIDSHHGNVYKIHKLGQEDKPLYLVTDGEGHWSHGATIKEARADLIYKINDRDTSAYDKLTLDDTLSYEEAIAAYRTITGACSSGTRDFVENSLPSPHKDKYTIREIIELTTGRYGNEIFAKFFE